MVEINDNFEALCREHDIETLDLWESLRPLAKDPTRVRASLYDGHSSEVAHKRIAEALRAQLMARHIPVFAEHRR